MRFGASKCVSERQSAFRSVKVRFGASKCVSERQNAFRSVAVGGGLLRFEFRISPSGNPLSIHKARFADEPYLSWPQSIPHPYGAAFFLCASSG